MIKAEVNNNVVNIQVQTDSVEELFTEVIGLFMAVEQNFVEYGISEDEAIEAMLFCWMKYLKGERTLQK